jgi:hypothetical protein
MLLSLNLCAWDAASRVPPLSDTWRNRQTRGAPVRQVAHPSDTWRTRRTRDAPVRHVAHPSDTWPTRQIRGAPVRHVTHLSDTWRTRQTRGAPARQVAHPSNAWRICQTRHAPVRYVAHPPVRRYVGAIMSWPATWTYPPWATAVRRLPCSWYNKPITDKIQEAAFRIRNGLKASPCRILIQA